MKILLATQNKHKIQEISYILSSFTFLNIITPSQYIDIPENDTSYIENALIKAKTWQSLYPKCYILADDSGLEVEALDNAPGVISSEYAGKNASSQEHIHKLLLNMNNLSNRNAKFVSYIILLSPDNTIFFSRGECSGQISTASSGVEGFGYDPIFLPSEYNHSKTLAELSEKEKNSISHRYKALLGLKDYIQYIESNNG